MTPKHLLQRFLRRRGIPLPSWLLDTKTRMMREMAEEVGKDDVVIDLGAHVGNATIELAHRARHVHAFEPNRDNFQELKAQTANYPNVTLHQKAVSDKNGSVKLFFEETKKKKKFFQGSTIVQGKPNIGYANAYDVETVSIVDVIDAIGEDVALIKMDIEGAEYIVLEALIASGRIDRVGKIYVECHADRIEGLQAHKDKVIAMAGDAGCLDKLSFTWA